MNVWRLVIHHEDPDRALRWSLASDRIAIGWGEIGDLRRQRCTGPRDVGALISRHYPGLRNAGTGGPSLWSYFARVQPGDLVVLSDGHRRRHVVQVTGPYVWATSRDSLGDYQHQRTVLLTDHDAEKVWAACGSGAAKGENIRWTLVLCARPL